MYVARPTRQLIPWPKTQLLIKYKKGFDHLESCPYF